MKLVILQRNLKEGLNIVERITVKSLTLPILNNILLKTEKNFLNISATDLEIGIKWWSLAKIEKDGEIVIPARVLSNFSVLLPDKPILLEKKNSFLNVECENFKNQIKGFSPEDYPIIPEVSKENLFEAESKLFCQSLQQVSDFATPSQVRPEISGIYLAFQKDIIKMAATDSFRLGEKNILFESLNIPKEISLILPQKTAKEIINIFSEKTGKLKIYFTPNQILFESQMPETPHPEVQLISRLIEGEYPAYQEIIPKKYETQIIFSRNEFLNQIKIASLFSGKTNEVKFKFDLKKGGTEIFSQNPDLGEHHSFLRGKIKGEFLEVSFNHRFLSEGLLSMKSSEVVFELNGVDGPAVLKPVGDQSYVYVVMPVKTS